MKNGKQKDEKWKVKSERWEEGSKLLEEGAVFLNDYRVKYMDSTEFLIFVHTKLQLFAGQTAILYPIQISIRKDFTRHIFNSTTR